MYNPLKNIVKAQKEGKDLGIYSCCSANPFVIEAALKKGKETDSCVLIESTANQVDQYGGYTGMKPADFRDFVLKIADETGYDTRKLFLGGDHLGPLTFAHLNEEEAMAEAETLVREYAKAGFTKIHLDTSMRLASDDPEARLSDEVIAARGARLARAAEEEVALLKEKGDIIEPVYIIGSEVPIPGGAQSEDTGMQITRPEDFAQTAKAFEQAFKDNGLDQAWDRVIAAVVQPGVEEKDAGCTEYDREKARDLCAAIKNYDSLVFEGHSTDYQTKEKLRELVEDGFGILKVGPGLTYAMREALFALAFIEKELMKDEGSHFMEVLDEAMLENPKYWEKHYHGTPEEIALKRKYSFSDRSRYYMPEEKVAKALHTMITNLKEKGIPLSLLSQFMPIQYTKVREGRLENTPEALIVDRIGNTIDEYLYATHQNELF